MKSLICDFINEHSNWEELLSNSPYNLKIKREDNYVLFMYNQIESDFYNPIVREARGIIIDIDRIVPVCWAFNKFGNYGEGYVDEIDWSTAHVQEKVDGSIIKIWNDGSWHISSNSCIDADKAMLDQSGVSIGELVRKTGLYFSDLDPNYTHIFELVSPYNRVVVDYGSEIKLYYTGKRNMITGIEERVDRIHFLAPAEYNLHDLTDCLAAVAMLNFNKDSVEKEGFVVVDGNFNRIKIKSPEYVAEHHIRSKQPTLKDIYIVWKKNEKSEFLSYFPAYEEVFDFIDLQKEIILSELNLASCIWTGEENRKEFACWINNPDNNITYKAIIFKAIANNFEWNDNYEDMFIKNLERLWKNGSH